MRRPATVPLVPIADGCDKCCAGILTAQAVEMAWWQRITYATTAWRISMGRRQVVESVNAALKESSQTSDRQVSLVGCSRNSLTCSYARSIVSESQVKVGRTHTPARAGGAEHHLKISSCGR